MDAEFTEVPPPKPKRSTGKKIGMALAYTVIGGLAFVGVLGLIGMNMEPLRSETSSSPSIDAMEAEADRLGAESADAEIVESSSLGTVDADGNVSVNYERVCNAAAVHETLGDVIRDSFLVPMLSEPTGVQLLDAMRVSHEDARSTAMNARLDFQQEPSYMGKREKNGEVTVSCRATMEIENVLRNDAGKMSDWHLLIRPLNWEVILPANYKADTPFAINWQFAADDVLTKLFLTDGSTVNSVGSVNQSMLASSDSTQTF